jgi:peptidylprolyl isomerase
MRLSRSRLTLTALTAVAVLAAGCGGSKSGSAGSGASGSGPAGSGGCEVQVSGAQGSKPQVTVPDCAAPGTLQSKDLIAGTGDAAVKAGDTVLVNYTLYGWEGKKLVQSSYDTGQPFPVQSVGNAQVIEGWNKGLIGMKQGTRRLLVVPASLGYADQGTPDGAIKPNEALVFVIDAVSVTPAR